MRRLGPLLGFTGGLALLCSGCVTMPQPVKVEQVATPTHCILNRNDLPPLAIAAEAAAM